MKHLALVAALMLLPAAAVAQTAPPPPAQPSIPTQLPATDMNRVFPSSGSSTDEINRRNLNDRARQAVENTSPARRSRAERVAALINAGDCPGAQALALAENDQRLAGRVEDICTAAN